ncbi:MAG: hypothetical protein M3395_05905 [Chloroflexota bacterium]|nr:hypothetical protein [Chloroflexota bacterium]
MTDPPESRSRPSIAERAAQRDRLEHGDRDRYSTLVRALQAGREVPLGRAPDMPFAWHPVAWTLLRLALVAAALYVIALVGWNWWRDQQVESWNGPDATVVQSGQRLEGCLAANAQRDDQAPTWVRFDGTVYVLSSRLLPMRARGEFGQTQYVESGYSQGRLRILLVEPHVAGEPPDELIIASPPAHGGRIYDPDPTCI